MAPARALEPAFVEQVRTYAARHAPELELRFHPQCLLRHGHFAGEDAARATAFLDLANDPGVNAIWFARGGYGSGRLLDLVLPGLGAPARDKIYLGYSDTGCLLSALYKAGIGEVWHGPMPADILRTGGEAAIARALDTLAGTSAPVWTGDAAPAAAFNLTVLASLCGSPYLPDLSGHVLHLEDVGEYAYRIDRAFFTLASTDWFPHLAGLRLGLFSDIPENDVDFAMSAREIAAHWAARHDIPVLGDSPIGHHVDNQIVRFGRTQGENT
ncbi:MAG: LD-carboxypeptidase [Hyphomonadaceae bacterium]|nr:LD-carboxypeptidase [Hyphomonadaceae bacterium]